MAVEKFLEHFGLGSTQYSIHQKYSSGGTRKRTTDEELRGKPMPRLRAYLSRVSNRFVVEVRLSATDRDGWDLVQAETYPTALAWAEAQAAWAEAVIASKPEKRVRRFALKDREEEAAFTESPLTHDEEFASLGGARGARRERRARAPRPNLQAEIHRNAI